MERSIETQASGILLVNKPKGLSSAQAVHRVKKILNCNKIGHTGTLDPFATGLLICCINRATKLSQLFLMGDKRYQATLKLGIETDTQDITGKVIARYDVPKLAEKTIIESFQNFVGAYDQLPPYYSALKHNGIPLYQLARKGIQIQKPSRRVTIYSIEIINISLPLIQFDVRCSSGTYIRTLSTDIGKCLGCGAYLDQLCRTESCDFHLTNAYTFEELNQVGDLKTPHEIVLPMVQALQKYETWRADHQLISKIQCGMAIRQTDFPDNFWHSDKTIKVVDHTNKLVAIMRKISEHPYFDIIRILE